MHEPGEVSRGLGAIRVARRVSSPSADWPGPDGGVGHLEDCGGAMAEDRGVPQVADPAALGLAAFALTTFLLSLTNAFGESVAPLLTFFGFAAFYGGTVRSEGRRVGRECR